MAFDDHLPFSFVPKVALPSGATRENFLRLLNFLLALPQKIQAFVELFQGFKDLRQAQKVFSASPLC